MMAPAGVVRLTSVQRPTLETTFTKALLGAIVCIALVLHIPLRCYKMEMHKFLFEHQISGQV